MRGTLSCIWAPCSTSQVPNVLGATSLTASVITWMMRSLWLWRVRPRQRDGKWCWSALELSSLEIILILGCPIAVQHQGYILRFQVCIINIYISIYNIPCLGLVGKDYGWKAHETVNGEKRGLTGKELCQAAWQAVFDVFGEADGADAQTPLILLLGGNLEYVCSSSPALSSMRSQVPKMYQHFTLNSLGIFNANPQYMFGRSVGERDRTEAGFGATS